MVKMTARLASVVSYISDVCPVCYIYNNQETYNNSMIVTVDID